MAEKYGMKLIKQVPFADYFANRISTREGLSLINKMQGLEVCSENKSYVVEVSVTYLVLTFDNRTPFNIMLIISPV
jgi:hypothetical protein